MLFFILGAGFLIKPGSLFIEKVFYGFFYFYLLIFFSTLFQINLNLTIFIIFAGLIFLFIYRGKKNQLSIDFFKRRIPRFFFIVPVVCFIFIFAGTYFSFSDSMYHYSRINKILAENYFINFSPFYGPQFFDLRYAYGFTSPFFGIFSRLLTFFNIEKGEAVDIIYNSTHIFLYILSVFSIYGLSKKIYGKKTAGLSIFVFSLIFIFIKSYSYHGYGFSLSSYPMAFMVYLFFYVIFFNSFYKSQKECLMIGFLSAGIHTFYHLLFFPLMLASAFFKKKKKYNFVFYVLGGLPLYLLRFIPANTTENLFFNTSAQINRWNNFNFSGISVPGFLPVVSLIVFFFTYKIYKKRKGVAFLLFFATIVSFIAPEVSSLIQFNSQKFSRIYQLFPVILILSPFLTFIMRKKRFIIILLIIFILFTGISKAYILRENLYTTSNLKELRQVFSQLPEKKKILADVETSMLIASFSDAYTVGVYREYSAPSVDNIKKREEAYAYFLKFRENKFSADYVLIIPTHREFFKGIDYKELGKGFGLLEL
ncbi:MAG: hypothetical protein ACQESP_06540 [Candidatus Muiribacteriota bacterium]